MLIRRTQQAYLLLTGAGHHNFGKSNADTAGGCSSVGEVLGNGEFCGCTGIPGYFSRCPRIFVINNKGDTQLHQSSPPELHAAWAGHVLNGGPYH